MSLSQVRRALSSEARARMALATADEEEEEDSMWMPTRVEKTAEETKRIHAAVQARLSSPGPSPTNQRALSDPL